MNIGNSHWSEVVMDITDESLSRVSNLPNGGLRLESIERKSEQTLYVIFLTPKRFK